MWLPCSDLGHAARPAETLISDPWLAPTGIDLNWPSTDGPVSLQVCIDGDKQFFTARCDWLHTLAGRPALLTAWLDAPGNAEIPPPAEAQEMLALRDQIQARMLDPPLDTGTLLRVTFPPGSLSTALSAARRLWASSTVKVTAEAALTPAARFVGTLRSDLQQLSETGGWPGATRVVVMYGPDDIRHLPATLEPAPFPEPRRSFKDQFDPEDRMAPGRVAEAAA